MRTLLALGLLLPARALAAATCPPAGSIVADDARAEAVEEARRVLARLRAPLPEAVKRAMDAAGVALVIVPAGKHVLDMPQARGLEAQLRESSPTTIDGRAWREVESFSNVRTPCGGHLWFVAERSILGLGGRDNRKGYTLVHEFAHMVEQHGLSAAQKAELDRLFEGYDAVLQLERRGSDGDLYWPFPESYSVQRREFFPQLTNVWLDAYQIAPGGGDRNNPPRTPAWLDFVPPWLPRESAFAARDWKGRTRSGELDRILGPSRRHEPLSALLGSVWGPRRSVLD